MQTEAMSALAPEARQLQRMESFLEELNARIARLSIALGISLKREDELERVIGELQEQAELHASHSTADSRLISQRIELRGLLVMRYGVEQRFVDQVGATATRHILVEAEEHLARVGFEPGADGIDLRRLFEEC
jgi:hypothetical protein